MDDAPLPSKKTRPPYPIVIGVAAFLVIVLAIFRFGSPLTSLPTLPKYHAVPPFSLTERSGKTITNADLKGKVWIVDNIFTTCPGPCPVLSATMSQLQTTFRSDPNVVLVSITVDPEDDTPAVLKSYADRFQADPNQWLFLTGDHAAIYSLVQDGLDQVLTDNRGQQLEPGQFLFTHSTQLVLVDQQGVMRGFYNGMDTTSVYDLKRAVKQLENEHD